MKRLTIPLCFVVALFVLVPVAWARQIPKVKLTSSGSSVSSTVGCGLWSIQCDAAVCENSGGGGAATADCTLGTANSSVSLTAGQLFDEDLPCSGGDAADTIAIISQTGTADCEVFRVSLGR